MDLNYLFYRQQIERSKAEAARTEAVRTVHEKLAIAYEEQISRAAKTSSSEGEAQSLFSGRAGRHDPVKASDVNATIAVAITAREVGQE